MKKHFYAVFLILVSLQFFGQVPDTTHGISKADYLQKSKNYKTAGWLFIISGQVVFLIGGLSEANHYDYTSPTVEGTQKNSAWLYVTAGVFTATGIGFFIAAKQAKKKSKANTTSFKFKLDKTESLQNGFIKQTPVPAISLRIAI